MIAIVCPCKKVNQTIDIVPVHLIPKYTVCNDVTVNSLVQQQHQNWNSRISDEICENISFAIKNIIHQDDSINSN